MILVMPVAGQSTRFPNMRPKFLLNHPDGELMLIKSIQGLGGCLQQIDTILVIGLQSHEHLYGWKTPVFDRLRTLYPLKEIKIVLLDRPTDNQPMTVYRGLEEAKITNQNIFIKDSDNEFNLTTIPSFNFVAVGDLHKFNVNAANKSYIRLNGGGTIDNVVEKKVVSNIFCVGGYGFASSDLFKKTYEKLAKHKDLYISHIIYDTLVNGQAAWFTKEVNQYNDWGTIEDWLKYTSTFKTYFVDIDGVLVGNSGQYFSPVWGTTDKLDNVDALNACKNAYIVLTTTRGEAFRDITEKQLSKCGVKYNRLIMGLPHSQRVLINDYSDTNPYPSAVAINIKRNSNELKDMLDA